MQVRGKNIPRPVKNWNQCGLNSRVLDVLQKSGFAKPMPIQAQALPAIMSGRDCIGIAKTGSGKTLAFVLPMLRHIKDQVSLCIFLLEIIDCFLVFMSTACTGPNLPHSRSNNCYPHRGFAFLHVCLRCLPVMGGALTALANCIGCMAVAFLEVFSG